MVYRPGLRGDINAILNPLVASGELKGFSTNLYDKPLPEQVIVTVVAGSEKEAEEVRLKVSQALEPLGQEITVQAEIRGQRARQEPEGPL